MNPFQVFHLLSYVIHDLIEAWLEESYLKGFLANDKYIFQFTVNRAFDVKLFFSTIRLLIFQSCILIVSLCVLVELKLL